MRSMVGTGSVKTGHQALYAWAMSPLEIVNRFIAAIEANDVERAVALAAPDISYENMPIAPIVGREAVAATLRGFLGAATAVEWRIVSEWEIGRTVVNERVDRFQIGSGWLELPVAGVFNVNGDDEIVLWRDYFDMSSYTSQLARLTATH